MLIITLHNKSCMRKLLLTMVIWINWKLNELIETPFTSVLDILCQKQPHNHPATRIYVLPCQNGGPHASSLSPALRAIRACRGGLQLLFLLLQQLAAKWQANDESPLGMTPEQYSLHRLMGKGIMNVVGQALRPPPGTKPKLPNITIWTTSNAW